MVTQPAMMMDRGSTLGRVLLRSEHSHLARVETHKVDNSAKLNGGFNARKTYLDQTRSGRRKQAKNTGTTHRRTVLVEGGWTNQAFVQQQRRCGNRRDGNKKGLSGRGRYRCRYGAAHHRDHQCLANF